MFKVKYYQDEQLSFLISALITYYTFKLTPSLKHGNWGHKKHINYFKIEWKYGDNLINKIMKNAIHQKLNFLIPGK